MEFNFGSEEKSLFFSSTVLKSEMQQLATSLSRNLAGAEFKSCFFADTILRDVTLHMETAHSSSHVKSYYFENMLPSLVY